MKLYCTVFVMFFSSLGIASAAPYFSGGPGYIVRPICLFPGDAGNYVSGLQGLDLAQDGTAFFLAGERYLFRQEPGRPVEELYDYGVGASPVFGTFVRYFGGDLYFGESSSGTVKSIPAGGGPAKDLFTLGYHYEGRFNRQSQLFLSANPDWSGNRIYAWWEGLDAPVLVAQMGGYSGPLAFDATDNLYYGRFTAYPPVQEEIVYFTAAQIAAALASGIPLTPADWTVYAAGVDGPASLVFDRAGAASSLFSAAAEAGTVSRFLPTGSRILGRGTSPGMISFLGSGPLAAFCPSPSALGLIATDYSDTYDSTAYLVGPCPQNFILGAGDYSTPGRSEIAVFRPSSGLWAVRGGGRWYFGRPGDLPVSGDYAGEGNARPAVFRPSTGLWAVSGGGRIYFGKGEDIPIPRDYSGRGRTEEAVFRPSSGLWVVRGLSRAYFGSEGDFPLPGDYNGSGTIVPTLFRPSSGLWAVRGLTRFYFGRPGDLPVPGDYSGEGTIAPAVFRPESGLWAVRGLTRFYFGSGPRGDIPVPLDLEGDGVLDPAVFRPSTGLWAVRSRTRVYFGGKDDFPAGK